MASVRVTSLSSFVKVAWLSFSIETASLFTITSWLLTRMVLL